VKGRSGALLLPGRRGCRQYRRMNRSAPLAVAVLLLMTGCGREEEPVANRYERAKAGIENKARAYEAQVENEVSAVEARLDNEADAFLNQQGANDIAANEAAANAAR
jgi:hypothetical protein